MNEARVAFARGARKGRHEKTYEGDECGTQRSRSTLLELSVPEPSDKKQTQLLRGLGMERDRDR